MTQIVSVFAATLITVPILSYLLTFIVAKQITKSHRKSVHISADFATLFFMLSVHYMIKTIWNISLFWVLILFLLLVAVSVSILNYKYREEIDFFRVLKGFWRINFILFIVFYMILTIYGTIQGVTGMFI
ncbi:quinol-cytochrome oxidoreductase complex cytochrome b subunit [Peribacillus deserti]|uniref:Quinol-cytochrome oxidoreductase complex cytochrome b subunit n=1 Tax=Peribacillus deserti TaxID=673318 RepID=A0ABS2QGT4_9BACI|nr:DUF3397 domain-containing protein [Peribacillus deserti]MBM7692373.1 quinol-cytochrome oxidoreductase complex cytochrome b subunit [Peribacillus deserti]